MELQLEEFKLPIELYFAYGILNPTTSWVEIEEIISILFQKTCKKIQVQLIQKLNILIYLNVNRVPIIHYENILKIFVSIYKICLKCTIISYILKIIFKSNFYIKCTRNYFHVKGMKCISSIGKLETKGHYQKNQFFKLFKLIN